MADLFDILFGRGGRGVRRDIEARVTVDESGNPKLEPIGGRAVNLGEDGSIDTVVLTNEGFNH